MALVLSNAAIPFLWKVTRENINIFNSNEPATQRDYSHDVDSLLPPIPLHMKPIGLSHMI